MYKREVNAMCGPSERISCINTCRQDSVAWLTSDVSSTSFMVAKGTAPEQQKLHLIALFRQMHHSDNTYGSQLHDASNCEPASTLLSFQYDLPGTYVSK